MVKPSTTTSCATTMEEKRRPQRHRKGVRMRSWGSWVSEIRVPTLKTRIWLGSYSSPDAASRAYDAALRSVKSRNASPKSIQQIAAAAAASSDSTNADACDNTDADLHPSPIPTDSPPPPPRAADRTPQPDWWEEEAFWSPKCYDGLFALGSSGAAEEEEGDDTLEVQLWSFS